MAHRRIPGAPRIVMRVSAVRQAVGRVEVKVRTAEGWVGGSVPKRRPVQGRDLLSYLLEAATTMTDDVNICDRTTTGCI